MADPMTNDEYVKANWAKLSPKFRDAHNRLRQMKGMETIPPPKIDRYVPKRGPVAKPYDFSDKEFQAAARQFMGPQIVMGVNTSEIEVRDSERNIPER